ncbi:hypothetical protein OE88DRAFT_1652543 [Heliocybe sulcata]|uniref:Peptidase M61 catalytic domain-containing protein n=1 Tax=Heliocybe sulcata TaxID=5364 RepID=A0A5C3NGD0_9AGAM|nr:hypothetical protein OE88DRAFT_1652543 [Heliocybe sulcata]
MRWLFTTTTLLIHLLPSLVQASRFEAPDDLPPALNLTLTPLYDASQNITSLDVRLVLENPNLAANDTLATALLQIGNVPCNQYSSDTIRASDDSGELALLVVNDDAHFTRLWLPQRDTHGSVTLQFTALPRSVDEHTPVGPRVDLRTNGEGILGTGTCFLPLPPDSGRKYDIHFSWGADSSPKGTSLVWTFGEGNYVRRLGTANVLAQSVYAAGPLKRVTSMLPPDESGRRREFGMYWFEEPASFNATEVALLVQSLFFKMAPFFEDSEDVYRVFVRKAPIGVGGSAYLRSFILEYDDVHIMEEDKLFNLIVHEMVHEWPRMQQSRKDLPEDPDSAWYEEGVADYYASLLPYRFGLHSDEEYLSDLNSEAHAYYTSPMVNLSMEEAARTAWLDGNAQRVPYYRGCMYLLKVDAQLRAATGGKKSVDDIMLELLRRKYRGEYYGIHAWLEWVERELGPVALADYDAMSRGYLIVPSKNAAGERFELVRADQERYELGFATDYLSKGVIRGLVPGSRAEKAGVRNGDKVLKGEMLWATAGELTKNMTLTVEREGEVLQFEYWPRSYEKVEAYQWTLKGEREEYDYVDFSSEQITM